MLTTSYKLKDFFFDRLRVQNAIDKKKHQLLSNAGGFVRKTARNSMRAKGLARKPPKNLTGKAYQRWKEEVGSPPASTPGTPPHRHTQDSVVTLRNILYGFNPGNASLIVGPVLLNGSKRLSPTIPELHEQGGLRQIREKRVGNRWVPVGKKNPPRPGQPARRRSVQYPARPYMAPAIQKMTEKSTFAKLLYGSSSEAAA